MTKHFFLLTLLLFYQISEELACYGSRDEIKKIGPYKFGKKNISREYWNITDKSKLNSYIEWIKEYYKNMTKFKDEMNYGDTPKGMSVPKTWKGYGLGHDGQDPPPMAIVEGAYSKPMLCFQDPDIGFCSNEETNLSSVIFRWGYNSHEAVCQTFSYSGCGGNDNNFSTKERCEESCIRDPISNCQKYGEYIEY